MNMENNIDEFAQQIANSYSDDGFLKLSALDLFGIDNNEFRQRYVPLWENFRALVEALNVYKENTNILQDEATSKIFLLLSGNGLDIVDSEKENEIQRPVDCSYTEWSNLRFKSHLILPWLYELLTEKVTLKTKKLIQTILNTDDVVIWSTDWCVKQPSSKTKFSWHQDSTYSGFTQKTGITIWVAFSDVKDPESGPVMFKRGSHRLGQLYHFEDDNDPDNMLAFGQTIPRSMFSEELTTSEVKESTYAFSNLTDHERNWELCPTVSYSLLPGEATGHGFHTVHSSRANCGSNARVGLAVRLVRADCGISGKRRDRVTKFAGNIKECLNLSNDAHGFEEELSDGCNLPFKELVREWKLSLEREKDQYFKGSGGNGKLDYKG